MWFVPVPITLFSGSTTLRADDALLAALGATSSGDLTLKIKIGLVNDVSATKPICVPFWMGDVFLKLMDSS